MYALLFLFYFFRLDVSKLVVFNYVHLVLNLNNAFCIFVKFIKFLRLFS